MKNVHRHPDTRKLVYEFFSREGSPGDYQAAIDASLAPVRFIYAPPYNRIIHVSQIVQIMSSVGPMEWGQYGTLPRLTNGVGLTIEDKDDNVILDFYHGITIKENSGWAIASTRHFINNGGVPPAVGPLEPSLAHAILEPGDHGLGVDMTGGDKLVFTLNDDLTGLTNQFFGIRGHFA